MNTPYVSQLWTYPIKSMKGISLTTSAIEEKGLKYDRQWMLVDKNNQFLSQQTHPHMALFSVALDEFGLRVSYPAKKDIIIPYMENDTAGFDTMNATIWNDQCQSIHVNALFDQWFSEALAEQCKLVYMPDSTTRIVDKNYTDKIETTRFSDGFPFLLLSEASVNDLNARIDQNAKQQVTLANFRPNIVVSGCEPYAEDSWSNFVINDIDFKVVKPCTRCVITTINPNTGNSLGKEPLATLNKYRRHGNKVIFGQNVLCDLSKISNTMIEVGQEISFK